jgi:tRNA threonylcarbamoyl adenosine modification protein (Sua5/YciO/YrdC/YwlC family)
MLVKIYIQNPEGRELNKVLECLKQGGVVIFPTDTIYAVGCLADNPKGIERVCKIMGKKPEKANLSLLCADLSHLSDYCTQITNPVFRMMRMLLPGPYTFILEANGKVPRIFKNSSKKTIGIRVPNHAITQAIIRELGPLVSSSIHSDNDIDEYFTDPELIHEQYEHQVDMVIDAGAGSNQASTILDCLGDEVILVRQGLGDIQLLEKQ